MPHIYIYIYFYLDQNPPPPKEGGDMGVYPGGGSPPRGKKKNAR